VGCLGLSRRAKMDNEAKVYLQKVEKMDLCIDQKILQLEDLKSIRFNVQAIDYEKEKVICSVDNNSFKKSDRYIDLDKEINKEIDDFCDLKQVIINQIQQLDNTIYIDILHKKYIEYKKYPNFETIAVEYKKSYRHITRLHEKALEAFRKKFLKMS
jgi:hypothetical protein